MATNNIVPCLWFDDQAERAAAFYTRTFPDGRVVATSRYPESGDNPSGKPPGSVLTVEFEIGGQRFTALNGGPMFKANPSISFFVFTRDAAETERIAKALVDGGEELMALGSYPWSERYAWVKDRFGVSWQVMPGPGPMIVPCLMFSDVQEGRAEEAMKFYTSSFDDAHIDNVERYTAGEGPEGTVKHGRFTIAGQPMVAMDSHIKHNISFNEALSFQVMCEDQGEVDRFWARLSDGGEQGVCGWLKDRFGVSWQIVPREITRLLTNPDARVKDRAFTALMKMKKPDIAALNAM